MARNPTQHPDIVEIGVAVSRAISVQLATAPRGLPRSFADGRLRRSGCIYARMQPIPKLTVQVVRIGLAAGGMRVEWRVASPEPAGGYSRQPEPVQGAFGVTV